MAGQVASMTGSGFFHPYARSVPTQPATPMPAQPAADSRQRAGRRPHGKHSDLRRLRQPERASRQAVRA